MLERVASWREDKLAYLRDEVADLVRAYEPESWPNRLVQRAAKWYRREYANVQLRGRPLGWPDETWCAELGAYFDVLATRREELEERCNLVDEAVDDFLWELCDRYRLEAIDLPRQEFSPALPDEPLDREALLDARWLFDEIGPLLPVASDALRLVLETTTPRNADAKWLWEQWKGRGCEPPDGELEPPPTWPARQRDHARRLFMSVVAELQLQGDRRAADNEVAAVAAIVASLETWTSWLETYSHELVPDSRESHAAERLDTLRRTPKTLTDIQDTLSLITDSIPLADAVSAWVEAARGNSERWKRQWLATQWRARKRVSPARRLEPPLSPEEQADRLRAARRRRVDERRAHELAARAADLERRQAAEAAEGRRARLEALDDALRRRIGDPVRRRRGATWLRLEYPDGRGLRLALTEGASISYRVSADGETVDGVTTLSRIRAGDIDPVLRMLTPTARRTNATSRARARSARSRPAKASK